MSQSIIAEKSFEFSEQVVFAYQEMIRTHKEFVLSKQLLRSGTSVGANISEAVFGQSNKDFISKLSIARKEANETMFWIRLLSRTGYLNQEKSAQLQNECRQLIYMLTAIIKTCQNKVK